MAGFGNPQWVPGVSGNPDGRPKERVTLASLRGLGLLAIAAEGLQWPVGDMARIKAMSDAELEQGLIAFMRTDPDRAKLLAKIFDTFPRDINLEHTASASLADWLRAVVSAPGKDKP